MGTTYQQLYIEGAQFPSSNFPQLLKRNGTNFPVASLAFDATTEEKCYWKCKARKYGSGNISAIISWQGDSATSGGVVWGAKVAAITPDADSQDVETKALGSQNTFADTHLGTTAHRDHTCTIDISNLDSIAEGDDFWLEISRVAANGSDTMTGDALLLGVELSYSDT